MVPHERNPDNPSPSRHHHHRNRNHNLEDKPRNSNTPQNPQPRKQRTQSPSSLLTRPVRLPPEDIRGLRQRPNHKLESRHGHRQRPGTHRPHRLHPAGHRRTRIRRPAIQTPPNLHGAAGRPEGHPSLHPPHLGG